MKKIVYVLGNELVKNDSLPIWLFDNLKKTNSNYKFVRFDPTEEIDCTSEEFIAVDTVIGLEKTKLFQSVQIWQRSPRVTAHDMDLPITLSLLLKLGKLKNICIIGVPPIGNKESIIKDVNAILNTI